MAVKTFDRAIEWFQGNPNEPYCYWAEDSFISIADKDNKQVLEAHPEIEDINDHTIVEVDLSNNVVYLSKFCPRFKKAFTELYNSGETSGKEDDLSWDLVPKANNYCLILHKGVK